MKAYFHYVFSRHEVPEDPTEVIKAPHIEKKAPEILTTQEVAELLDSQERTHPRDAGIKR